jgi:hypothetical protein
MMLRSSGKWYEPRSQLHQLNHRPERMLNGGFKNLAPDSWKPFGNGVRGCIGRPFAWQEALLIVAMVRTLSITVGALD